MASRADGHLQGLQISRNASSLSIILFADDTLLFAKATRSEASHLLDIIKAYSSASSQCINFFKSHVYFSRLIPLPLKWKILQIFHMREMLYNDKYLGLPTILGRSKQKALHWVEDCIYSKPQAWKQKPLSQASRATLIQSVLTEIPSYSISLFRYPK